METPRCACHVEEDREEALVTESPMPEEMSGVSRRTIVKGAAWSVPVIATAAAVPGAAASGRLSVGLTISGDCVAPGGALPDAAVAVTDESGPVTGATVTLMFSSSNGGEVTIGGKTYPTESSTLTLAVGETALRGVVAKTAGTVLVTATAKTSDGRSATSTTQAYEVCQQAGTLYAWGSGSWAANAQGSDENNQNTPVLVQGLPAGAYVTSITGGERNAFAVLSDGTAYSWGKNDRGNLGIGTTDKASTATKMLFPGGVAVRQISMLPEEESNPKIGLALSSAGQVYVWGSSNNGGNTTGSDLTAPTLISSLGTDNKQVAAGQEVGYALKEDGSIWVWGRNDNYEYGRGDANLGSATPQKATWLGDGWDQIVAARQGAFALRGGKVYSWGREESGWGYLTGGPNGKDNPRPAPQQVIGNGLEDQTIVKVFFANNKGYALDSTGAVWAWGDNTWGGALGTGGSQQYNSTPARVPIDEPIVQVCGGDTTSWF
ncbi:hypothetical protein ABE10_10905, partial [Bacillus toyonensis]|nr:hypothetical protein [Bacillus toyonensis]